MRRGLYVMLMVVLVLRGLAGSAMAAGVLPPLQPIEVLQSQEHSHHPVPGEAHATPPMQGTLQSTLAMDAGIPDSGHTPASDHDHDHDHAEHAAAASPCDGSVEGCTAHDHHSAACSACEICHSSMLDAPAALTPTHLSTAAPQPLAAAQFDSAPAALAIKPPIA
ncbi:hypothetical protein [Acidovorax sp. ACV01]|uniref:hypothetical protein n=1 Tax=Acidovorax sp. ACV01 TaxID=2769311 RepID=UPI0017857663|nr:hypothetical protein [Acidovorax sp. ACV01]MBD9390751.1 hypothetical protein [Acidovorax sp. ACV01]